MGAALRGTGNFKPGMVVQTATRDPQHGARAVPDLRLGHRPAAGRCRRGARDAHRRRRSATVWLLALLPAGRLVSEASRPATGRRGFGSGCDMLTIGLPAGAEFAMMAVYLFVVYASSGRSAPRRRRASASASASCRRASCRSWRSASRWRRWRARTSARASRDRVTRDIPDRRCDGGGGDGAASRRWCTSRRPRWSASSPPTRRWCAWARSTCASSSWNFVAVGRRVRRLQHVPGDGQHLALARHLVHAHPASCSVLAFGLAPPAGLPVAVGVVPVGGVGHAAGRDDPAAGQAGVPAAAGAGGRGPRRHHGRAAENAELNNGRAAKTVPAGKGRSENGEVRTENLELAACLTRAHTPSDASTSSFELLRSQF